MRECMPSRPRRWERECNRSGMLCARVAESTSSVLLPEQSRIHAGIILDVMCNAIQCNRFLLLVDIDRALT